MGTTRPLIQLLDTGIFRLCDDEVNKDCWESVNSGNQLYHVHSSLDLMSGRSES